MLPNRQIKTEAKAALSGNWGIAIGIWVVYLVLSAVIALTFIGSIILSGVLAFGFMAAYLTLVRTKNTSFETLFSGFSNFGTTCVAGILQTIFLTLWTLLFIIPGIVKIYSYSMTYYVLHDNPNLSASEAITESRRMMNGYKGKLFCLDLSFIGWFLLSALTLGLLGFYVLPYYNAARARFYEALKNKTTVEG